MSDLTKRAPRRGRWLRWAAIAGLLLVVGVTLAFASRFGDDPNLTSSPLMGKPAPEWTLASLAQGGGEVSLSDYEGRVVVINFFASWCLECRKEHSDLVATAEAFSDRDVQFVGIAHQDDPEDSRDFLDELGWSDHTTYVTDQESRTAISYGVFGVPETFFVDANGTVVGKIIGEANALILGDALDTILAGETFGTEVAGNQRSGPGEE